MPNLVLSDGRDGCTINIVLPFRITVFQICTCLQNRKRKKISLRSIIEKVSKSQKGNANRIPKFYLNMQIRIECKIFELMTDGNFIPVYICLKFFNVLALNWYSDFEIESSIIIVRI